MSSKWISSGLTAKPNRTSAHKGLDGNGIVTTKKIGKSVSDERLPLRWGVILSVAVGVGIGVGTQGGVVAGVGTGLVVVGLLFQMLGG